MSDKLLASIDIGTNTFRLLIAEVRSNSSAHGCTINEIYSERINTRLGDGISEHRMLADHAIDKSIAALKKFKNAISRYNVFQTSAVATSALREADNSKDFQIRAKNEADIDIKVISGDHEARLTALGMLMDFDMESPALLVDIGGGSTELVLMERSSGIINAHTPRLIRSLNLGVVYLAGKYMKHDPPPSSMLSLMEDEISRAISHAGTDFNNLISGNTLFIGTAGTITALAAICQGLVDFNHERIHKYNVTHENIKRIYKDISIISSSDRARIIPFDLARLDIIVPGTLILLDLMNAFGFSDITVSNHGLREGILIDLFGQLS